MMNVLNGGAHADNSVDFQEFMIVPAGAPSFSEALRMGAEVFHNLKKTLPRPQAQRPRSATRAASRRTSSPTRRRSRRSSRASRRPATRRARTSSSRWTPRRARSTRAASTTSHHEGRKLSSEEMASYWADMAGKYPIVSIEDGMDEEDWDGWKALTDRIGDSVQLVGDDLFVTNTERLKRGIDTGVAQLDPHQGQPDRHADRDARRDLDGARGRLHRGHVAPLGRDRGRDDRRPRRRHRLRADQDRRARRARTASRSTTSSCASRSSSAATRPTRAAASSAAERSARPTRSATRPPGPSSSIR